MNDNEPFTNRRGRQIQTGEVLGSVKVDNDPEIQVTSSSVVDATKERKRRITRLPKRFKLFLVVVLLLVIGLPLLIGEYLTADYNKSAQESVAKVKALAQDSAQVQKNSKALRPDDLNTVVTGITTIRDEMCKGGFFDNLAELYPRAKKALTSCTLSREKVASLSRELTLLQQILAYAEELERIIRPVTRVPENEQFANIASQQENWKTVHDQLKQLSPPSVLRTAHDGTVTSAGEIAKSWTTLVDANSEQNVASFQATEASLAKQYEQFRLLTNEYTKAINTIQTQISRNYDRLNDN